MTAPLDPALQPPRKTGALALIGVICVGVSSWNLYVRWGKPD